MSEHDGVLLQVREAMDDLSIRWQSRALAVGSAVKTLEDLIPKLDALIAEVPDVYLPMDDVNSLKNVIKTAKLLHDATKEKDNE